MTTLRWRKNQRSLLAFLAVCLFVILTLQFPGVQKLLRDTLVVYLIKGDDLSQHCGENGKDSSGAIYVLGGSRESLEKKFVTAARLYHQRIGTKIMLLREPGIMDYSPLMRRNQSYDEWVTGKLKNLGVRIEDIEAVSFPIGFFGTLSEAKSILKIVSGQGYSRLALVTSAYHTRRTWASFIRYAEDQDLNLCIYSSDENIYFRDILPELFKLVIYEMALV